MPVKICNSEHAILTYYLECILRKEYTHINNEKLFIHVAVTSAVQWKNIL